MKKKIIGLSPRVCTEDGSTRHNVQDTYIAAMNSLDFIPIILPMDNDDIQTVLDICDGFLVVGGWDITPSYFGQEDQGSKGCDERLDKIDKIIVEYAYSSKKPLLGICRGHQAINVFSLNLEQLLLTRPLKNRVILGLGPAFRRCGNGAVINMEGECV